jgi:hypothetical protein
MVKRLTNATIHRWGLAILVPATALGLGLGAAGATASSSASACSTPSTAGNFQTAKFHPPHVHICTRKAHEAPGMIFLAPFRNGSGAHPKPMVGQPGAMMLDQGGNTIWFHPAAKGQLIEDFQTQTLKGQPVLTFWQGKIAIPPANTTLPPGAPVSGSYSIYDEHYHLIKTIKAQGKGWITDFHDLVITHPTATYSQGTALFLAAKKVSAGGGGALEDQEIQEVNLANGHLVWSWDVHKFIGAHTSHVKPPSHGVWDPYHANSIDIRPVGGLPDGNVLLSLRNTFGIYNINHATNKIIWKLINGKGSTFKLSKNAKFSWQHDVHYHGKNQVSMFDDACCNLQPFGGHAGPARGLLLSLKGKSATMARQYHHANTSLILTLGSFRYLSDGHAFVGWGQSPYYSEYTAAGSLIYDAAMPSSDMSYRALKEKWIGLPGTKAIGVAVKKVGGKPVVYASWNGATKVAKWRVLAGSKAGSVNKSAGAAKKSSFETSIHATNAGPFFKVQALDSHGHVLGTSKVVKL